jgi:hypothetical protein
MEDTIKKIKIYFGDWSIRVMGIIALFGFFLAVQENHWGVLPFIAMGWIIYLLEEYLVHRFIFHASAPQNQTLFNLLYKIHYGHHDQARSKDLLFTPLWFGLPLAGISVLTLLPFFSLKDAMIIIFGGGTSAYLVFEWLHLTSHFVSASTGKLGRYITRRHGKHHFIDYDHWYTVSPGGQFFDKIFGSDPNHYRVVPNAKTCGLEPKDPRLIYSRAYFGMDHSLENRTSKIDCPVVEQTA